MPDEKYTRCPGCRTIFRVTAAQLALREGQVRCGSCRTVFDGNLNLISLAPAPRREDEPEQDEAALGPPTVTLRSAHALEPAPSAQRAPPAKTTAAKPALHVPPRGAEPDDEDDDDAERDAVADYENRFAWEKKRPARRLTAVYAAAIPFLLIALAAQAAFHFRDAIVAYWPSTRPALLRMCDAAGCAVRPLRDVAALSIEASDLQADPAHKGLLILSATIRNRASYPLAYPMLELTLTDAKDDVVVRRALVPAEYAGGTADVAGGIPGNGEVAVKLFFDASATTQAGYRLYLFYP